MSKKGNGGEGKQNWKELRECIGMLTAAMDRQMEERRAKRIVEEEMREALKKIGEELERERLIE